MSRLEKQPMTIAHQLGILIQIVFGITLIALGLLVIISGADG